MNDGNLLTIGWVLELERPASLVAQGIEFTARTPGSAGNSVTVTFEAGSDLAVAVNASALTITLAGADVTIQQVVTAIRASATATALVDVDLRLPGNTLAVVATAVQLADGDEYTYGLVQDIKTDTPTREYKAYDGNGHPAARRQLADFTTASGTIVGVVGAMVPTAGDRFAYDGKNYVVSNVSSDNSGEQPIIWSISATQVYNA